MKKNIIFKERISNKLEGCKKKKDWAQPQVKRRVQLVLFGSHAT